MPRHICHGSSMDGERSQQCWTVARFDSGPWLHSPMHTAHVGNLKKRGLCHYDPGVQICIGGNNRVCNRPNQELQSLAEAD